VVVKDQEQADKVLEVLEQLPLLKSIIVIDMKGMRNYHNSRIISYNEVEDIGRQHDHREPNLFDGLVQQTQPEDVAFIVYTSGTTGDPKGAMISHRSVLHQVIHGVLPILHINKKDKILSYLPLCHILERDFSMAVHLVVGNIVNFAESIQTVQKDIQEISPTFFAAVPRILEKMHSEFQIKMENSSRFKRALSLFWIPVGEKIAEYRLNQKKIPPWWLFLYLLGYLFCFRPIRDKLGLLRCRVLMTGGAPIAPEILMFLRALGVNALEMYGATETSGACSGPSKRVKYGSVGEPIEGIEFRLDKNGEILFKGDSIFVGYYRDNQGTNRTIRDGWLHTGDVGELDEDGSLYIVDRIKDIIISSDGKNISPSEIENKIKCSPYMKEAMVIGDKRKFLTALIQIDYENVGNFATNQKIAYTTYKSLAKNPTIYELVQGELDKVNKTLARVESIKKFKIIEKELDQDDNELTATQKVRRKQVTELFREEIDAMYH